MTVLHSAMFAFAIAGEMAQGVTAVIPSPNTHYIKQWRIASSLLPPLFVQTCIMYS